MSLPFLIKKYRNAALLFLFLALGILSYWPSYFGERIWDDHFLVGTNPFIRSPILAWEAYQHWLYPFSNSTYFRPTQNVSYIWDYWAWGEELFGYHLTNSLIHAGAAFLLAFLFRRIAKSSLSGEKGTTRIDLLAWGAALLWLVHPIHHAGVAYVSGRADSLAALFSISAWLLCERGLETRDKTKSPLLFIAAAALGWLALCSKEIALTWYGLFTLYHVFLRTDRQRKQRIAPILGAGSLVLIYALHRNSLPMMAAVEAEAGAPAAPFMDRVLLMLKALGDYVSLIFCPANLHMERTLTPDASLLAAASSWMRFHISLILPLGILALLFAFWLCFRQSPDRKFYRFTIGWFLLGFLPISNLFPLNAQVAEHWIYMPSAALLLLTMRGFVALPLPRAATQIAVLGGICITFVTLTHQQSRYWVSEEHFLRTTIARGGDTPRIRTNLARVIEQKGDLAGAEAVLREALSHHPDITALKSYLASLLIRRGQAEEAAKIVGFKPIESKRPPIPWTIEVTQIRTLVGTGQMAEAQEILSRTLQRWPLAWDLVALKAAFYEQAGESARAIETLRMYTSHNWWHYDAVVRLAQSLAKVGRDNEAVAKYEEAARLDIRATKPIDQIVAIHLRQKQLGEALLAQAEAVDRAPDSLPQRERLAQIYEALGYREEAEIERMIFPRLQQQAAEHRSSPTPVPTSLPAQPAP